MKRIMVLGAPGSGKTVLSKRLGEVLGLPVYHLDALMWEENWVEKPLYEMEKIQNGIIFRDSWIADGYYHKIADRRFERADTVIILDIPRCTCILRALRSDIALNCSNKIDMGFLKYIWNYKKQQLREILAKAESCGAEVIVLRKTEEIDAFIMKYAKASEKGM